VLYTYFGQRERIPQILKQDIPTLIVDDCSNAPLTYTHGIDILQVLDDIKWNQPGARNLGFQELKGWVICADIDHLITKEIYDAIDTLSKQIGTVYFLGREDQDSYNLYVMHTDDFEKIGGYDEDFCGEYGYDDLHFLHKCKIFLQITELRYLRAKVYAYESSSKGIRDCTVNQKLLAAKLLVSQNNTEYIKTLKTAKRIRFTWKRLTPRI
jgi:hypothetical protein